MNDSDEISRYIQLADEWGAALGSGNSTVTNRLHDQLEEVFSRIRNSHREHELFDQVDRVGDGAAFCIASYIVKVDLPRARAIYERLLRSTVTFIPLSAEYILKEMDNDRTG